MRRFSARPGMTLIELLLFVAITGIIAAFALPMLYSSTDHRLLQQTIAIVEQNGAQLLQTVALRAREGERILDPPLGSTGAVLTIQMGSGSINPTIMGISSGSLVIIRRDTKQTVSSTQVAIEDFVVRNTSTSASRPSAQISFTVSRTIRLQMPLRYARTFEALFTFYPADVPQGGNCVCDVPVCVGHSTYQWSTCTAGICYAAATPLAC